MMLALLWRMTRGYRLRPWRSPYLRWRFETYSGVPAESIAPADFWRFAWRRRRDLAGYLLWAGRMRRKTRIASSEVR
jgi:hypothetical protein